MKKIVIFIPLLLLASLLPFLKVTAQSDTGVQIIKSGTAYVEERFYSGTGDVSIEIPCIEIREKQRETILLYGALIFPDGDGDNDLNQRLIPSKGETWSAIIQTYAESTTSINIVSMYNLPIFPGCKQRLEWTNPSNIDWKLVLYIRGYAN
jgi:hypothetical protein